MRTSLLLLVPCVLLGGLIVGVYKLDRFSPVDPPCAIGGCPLSLYGVDSEKTFVYRVGTRFDVSLNEAKSPRSSLRCIPDGVISNVQNTSNAQLLYTSTFEALAEGTCTLTADNFSSTIIVQ
ncbi:MAG: hypothetical protein Q7S50_01240 [bacterium]|nr:hypothetical protein [bacterium]